jgi:glycosyltransferase involved in cell wall biosynthesis
MSKPRFSIVTIAWNDRAGIAATWRSLVDQSFVDWEWIVVDGASTDGTAEWLSSLTDARVSWRSEPDDGIYPAMNKGIERADGELVLFLNAGDRLSDADVLERVHQHQQQGGWSWAYGGLRYVDADGQVVGTLQAHAFSMLAFRLGLRFVPHPATYFERGLLERVAPYDPAFGMAADQELMMRAAQLVAPASMPWPLADFALGGVSTTAPADAFVLASRDIRRAHAGRFGGSALIDDTVTSGLAFAVRCRSAVARRLRPGTP